MNSLYIKKERIFLSSIKTTMYILMHFGFFVIYSKGQVVGEELSKVC